MFNPRIFIIGSPRSGTTWVGKLFDADPWVIYRHEPDSACAETSFPAIVYASDYPRHLAAAARYLDKLYEVSTVKTNAGKVGFSKEYRGPIAEFLRRSVFLGLRAMEQMRPLRQLAREVSIPDFISTQDRKNTHEVVKSVIAGGRAGLYARAKPDIRFILVIRHPAGVVASMLRGKRIGKMPGEAPIGTLSTMPGAVERGLSDEFFMQADTLERISWWWVLFNEKMIRDTQDCENCLLVNYDEMCLNPSEALRIMYRHAKLELSDKTAGFLEKSTTNSDADQGYFGLFRNPQQASNRWRQELSKAEIDRVQAITQDTLPGSLFGF